MGISTPAHAADSARTGFLRMESCVEKRSLEKCRDDITADSVILYDRFTGYNLARCLPAKVQYISQKPLGKHMLVRASAQDGRQDHVLRLVFSQEEAKWKLNVPESLHLWLGDNWQNRITLIEQLYLMLRQQFGDRLDCSSAQALVK